MVKWGFLTLFFSFTAAAELWLVPPTIGAIQVGVNAASVAADQAEADAKASKEKADCTPTNSSDYEKNKQQAEDNKKKAEALRTQADLFSKSLSTILKSNSEGGAPAVAPSGAGISEGGVNPGIMSSATTTATPGTGTPVAGPNGSSSATTGSGSPGSESGPASSPSQDPNDPGVVGKIVGSASQAFAESITKMGDALSSGANAINSAGPAAAQFMNDAGVPGLQYTGQETGLKYTLSGYKDGQWIYTSPQGEYVVVGDTAYSYPEVSAGKLMPDASDVNLHQRYWNSALGAASGSPVPAPELAPPSPPLPSSIIPWTPSTVPSWFQPAYAAASPNNSPTRGLADSAQITDLSKLPRTQYRLK